MGNRLSKIYTRTGDNGKTGMADGSRVSKADNIFTVMGDIDELNAHIGMIRALLTTASSTKMPAPTNPTPCKISHYQHQLSIIQHLLFNIGGELAMPEYQGVKTQHIDWLEADIDAMNAHLQPLKDFILPAGKPLTCQIHIARTVCRRAERHAARLNEDKPNALSTTTYQFINRLSDWLFVFARLSSHTAFLATDDEQNNPSQEVLWDKNILDNFNQSNQT
ncbi:cob(I)yrinic acid a,c-diamide adenosyltransferase [Psychrobacter sp. I-STPA10]|uniref:cob(I)yrinic acid a,c-diamide adenosyltransferase n=1 Tax=Psychrobacter sp. I-STPA10 TaxID=2585769 RepID=UPI001E640F55|nr:cob(I)yrinic acid a,c-diamide adenosyltransferase [Psychrobacter sp. I-STPA10]